MEELAANRTTVRVVSKYRMETIVGGRGDYSESILNEIARTLSRGYGCVGSVPPLIAANAQSSGRVFFGRLLRNVDSHACSIPGTTGFSVQ